MNTTETPIFGGVVKITTLTLEEFFDAMEKNGYPKGQHAFIRYDTKNSEVLDACAIGQASLNLGLSSTSLSWGLRGFSEKLMNAIVYANDNSLAPVPDIARKFRKRYNRYRNSIITVREARY